MIPIRYNLRSIIVRRMATAMTVSGVALTVAVFVSILAMVQGLENTFVDTGEPLNLVLIRQGSQSEVNSFFNRDIKGIIETLDGVDAVAGEIVVLINHPRITGETTNIIIRGVSEKSLELRPKVRVAEGRLFRNGLREVVVSRSISNRFKDARLGDVIQIGRAKWTACAGSTIPRPPTSRPPWWRSRRWTARSCCSWEGAIKGSRTPGSRPC